jgi:hypothetical protein
VRLACIGEGIYTYIYIERMLLYPPKSPNNNNTGATSKTGSPKTVPGGGVGEEVSVVTGKSSRSSPERGRIETQQRPADAHPIDGRVPIEASFNVMKMVIGATGTEAKTTGKTTSSQLRSLRTEPSLKLLRTTSWRDFFDAEDPQPENGGNANSHANASRSGSPGVSPSMKSTNAGRSESPTGRAFHASASAPSLSNSHSMSMPKISSSFVPYMFNSTSQSESNNESNSMLNLYQTMVQRIQQMWAELKIPAADVKFYKETLCSGNPRGLDHCRELARYIKTLSEHRSAVLHVLQTIEVREILVSHLQEVLLAFNRKFVYRKSYESQSGDKAVKGLTFDSNLAWKEELVEVLKELQVQTIEVIQAIQRWRKGLWRPQSFMWRGQDYIAKMKNDISVLGSDLYMSQLTSIPIYRHELTCILFHDADDMMMTHGQEVSQMMASSWPAGDNWRFKTEMTTSSPAVHNSSNTNVNVSIVNAQLREYFMSGDYSHEELEMAARVVTEDAKLQRAIRTEKDALLAKKVFIPTLKVDIMKEGEPRRANPFHNKYHAHIKRPKSAQVDGSSSGSNYKTSGSRPGTSGGNK